MNNYNKQRQGKDDEGITDSADVVIEVRRGICGEQPGRESFLVGPEAQT